MSVVSAAEKLAKALAYQPRTHVASSLSRSGLRSASRVTVSTTGTQQLPRPSWRNRNGVFDAGTLYGRLD
jgi:hypothetical protein